MSSKQPPPNDAPSPARPWVADFLASIVVFLVALPLCIGIAVACGVPPERGLITGIVGGIVVGRIAGAPLLVSGPAASLIVVVYDLVETHGLVALAPVVMLAGVWQAIAGVLRLGQWFRAVAPALIHGMLVGIGVLICASQLHVAIDGDPHGSFVADIVSLPGALIDRFTPGAGPGIAPVLLAAATILILVGWTKYRPKRLRLVPGHLVSLLTVTIAALVFGLDVVYLDISPNFFSGLDVVSLQDFSILMDPSVIALSFVFAFVASAATLLTANAIDQRQSHQKTNYDREMFAQGVGNVLTGSLGGLPMTGVIVRSSVNVDAGARTRLSTNLHGLWLLLFVSVAPEVLERIPKAALGAILVYVGFKLIDHRGLRVLYRQGRAELFIALVTLFGVVFIDLFLGIIAGLVVSFGKIVYTFARLEVRSESSSSNKVHDLHLAGSATFLQLPRLAQILDQVPRERELHVHIDRLDHIDHACLELLSNWNKRRETEGVPGMVVKWDELTDRYRSAQVGGSRDVEDASSLLSQVWAEWKRLYAPKHREGKQAQPRWSGWLDESRVCVGANAETVDDVLRIAARMFARVAGKSADEIAAALRARVGAHIALGAGVSIPHTPIDGIERPLAALVITSKPLDVSGEPSDLFFVLLAPKHDPTQHLHSLAHVGRLCHQPDLLTALRRTDNAREAVELIEGYDVQSVDLDPLAQRDRRLAVLVVDGEDRMSRIARVVGEAFGNAAVVTRDHEPFEALRRATGAQPEHRLLIISVNVHDIGVLRALLHEQRRMFPDDVCRLHLLRHDLPDEPRLATPTAP